jgi:transcriptional regulator with XRE-family HTH domain
MKETKRAAGIRPKKELGGETLKGLGVRLRQVREKRGLTQEDLARAIGSDWMRVSRYERGVNLPAADKLVALAAALRVSTDFLLRGDRTGEEPVEFSDIRLYERFRALDQLPRPEHEAVLHIVDAVLAKNEFARFAERIKRTA